MIYVSEYIDVEEDNIVIEVHIYGQVIKGYYPEIYDSVGVISIDKSGNAWVGSAWACEGGPSLDKGCWYNGDEDVCIGKVPMDVVNILGWKNMMSYIKENEDGIYLPCKEEDL